MRSKHSLPSETMFANTEAKNAQVISSREGIGISCCRGKQFSRGSPSIPAEHMTEPKFLAVLRNRNCSCTQPPKAHRSQNSVWRSFIFTATFGFRLCGHHSYWRTLGTFHCAGPGHWNCLKSILEQGIRNYDREPEGPTLRSMISSVEKGIGQPRVTAFRRF
jgi:hypothetical protein